MAGSENNSWRVASRGKHFSLQFFFPPREKQKKKQKNKTNKVRRTSGMPTSCCVFHSSCVAQTFAKDDGDKKKGERFYTDNDSLCKVETFFVFCFALGGITLLL